MPGGNREAKSMGDTIHRSHTDQMGHRRESRSEINSEVLLPDPSPECSWRQLRSKINRICNNIGRSVCPGHVIFFERSMFANLAAKVCQIVRNGKGREKQSAPRCVRSCEMVKGETKTIEGAKKKSREPSLVGRDTWMAKRAPCALSTLKHPEGESMQHRSAISPPVSTGRLPWQVG